MGSTSKASDTGPSDAELVHTVGVRGGRVEVFIDVPCASLRKRIGTVLRYGVTSMCLGSGMGAASVIELE